MKQICLGLCLALAVSCQSRKLPEPQSPALGAAPADPAPSRPFVPAQLPRVETKFTAQVVALPRPNAFEVNLQWPAGEKEESWLIERTNRQGRRELGPFSQQTTSLTDKEVAPGERYLYTLYALTGGSRLPVAETSVLLPRDLVVDRVQAVKKVRGIYRLFLSKDARLTNLDQDLEINVEELYSEGGAVSTFAEPSVAPEGKKGRDGGSITIRAKRGSGVLYIYASGENGGTGRAGSVGHPGGRGMPGKSGQARGKMFHSPGRIPTRIDIDDKSFEERRREYPLGSAFWHRSFECTHPPTAGTPGEAGGPGGRGEPGGPGGNSSKLYVFIENPIGFEVKPTVLPGRGGAGGPGGPGGPGGAGGAPGERDRYHVCPAASYGPNGPTGPKGEDGAAGTPGRAMPYCLRLGSAVFGDCQAFETDPSLVD